MKKVEIITPTVLQTNQKIKLIKKRVAAYCRVSTDHEEQINSYESQIKFYNQMIDENPEWVKVDIYADKGISGTQAYNRDEFQRMIADARAGKIDLVLCKSISRFGRNVIDILQYIRELKNLNIAIIFEEEHINTLEPQGEILLAVLATLAQQGSTNISYSSRKGNEMKMRRGEPVGQYNVYGLRYITEIENYIIIEEEAEVVRKVFDLYLSGLGTAKVARKMNEEGYLTPRGKKWRDTTVADMIKNYKYRGDLMGGLSYTVDPLEHTRAENRGEKPFYHAQEHHEGIIEKSKWDEANRILKKRSAKYNGAYAPNKYSSQYAFSSKLVCGYCGETFNRWQRKIGKDKHDVITWICSTKKQNKQGRTKFCDNFNYREETIQEAFIKAYSLLCENNKSIIEQLLNTLKDILSGNCHQKEIDKIEKQISEQKQGLSNLIDLKAKYNKMDDELFDSKYNEYTNKIDEFVAKLDEYKKLVVDEESIMDRINRFQTIFEAPDVLKEFSESVFETIVDSVVIGKIEEDGTKNPDYIKFILNTGSEIEDSLPNDKRRVSKKDAVLGDNDVAQNNVSYYGNGEPRIWCSSKISNWIK